MAYRARKVSGPFKKRAQVYAIFRPPYLCTTEVHVNGGLILGSVNLCKTFRRLSEVWESVETLEVSSLIISYNITIS